MKTNPKLSVCIATYNRLPYLRLVIPHIFSELDGKISYELIIADGGSGDGTLEYLRSIASGRKNFKLIEVGELIGLTKTLNICFRESAGKYLYFQNDHLFVVGDELVKSCDFMDRNGEVYATLHKFYISGKYVPYKMHLKFKYVTAGNTFVMRKCEEVFFDEKLNAYFIDCDIILKLFVRGYVIAYPRNITAIEVKIRHKDDVHSINHKRLLSDKKYFFQKWARLEILLERRAGRLGRLRAKIFPYLIRKLTFFIGGRGKYIMEFFERVNYCEPFPKFSDFSETGIPPAFSDAVDLRYKVCFLERLYDFLYENSVAYRYFGIGEDDFFLYQKLPDDLIMQIDRL